MDNLDIWIKNIICGKTYRRVIPIMTNPGVEMCKRTIKDAVTSGEIHAEAICKLNEKYPADAVTAIMDLTVEAEAFGANIIFPDNEIPSVVGTLLHDKNDIDKLEIPSLENGRIKEFLSANKIVANSIKDKPVFAGCIGPFSLAARLMGLSEIMIAMFTEPETISLLLEKCTLFINNYCKAVKETGVDGIIMAEPVAGLISNDDSMVYSSKYIKNIVTEIQDNKFLLVLHNCGNSGHCTEAMIASGAGALHFGNKINMIEVLKVLPKDIIAMGNINPVDVLKLSSPTEIYKMTFNLLKNTSTFNNFILSTGCDVPPGIPEENIEAYYSAVVDYNR